MEPLQVVGAVVGYTLAAAWWGHHKRKKLLRDERDAEDPPGTRQLLKP